MAVKGCQITTRPEEDDYVATVGRKKYRCHTIRGCFKAANGQWPKNQAELDKFIELVAKGEQ